MSLPESAYKFINALQGDYKTMFLFSHRTVSGGILYWKEYYMKLLSGEKGVAHPLNGWEIVDCYILEHRKTCCCTFDFYTVLSKMLSGSLRLVSNSYYFVWF